MLQQKTKKRNYTILCGLLGIAMLVFAYIIGRQILVLPVILFWCATIIFSDVKDATYLLLLISSVSKIMIYSQITWFIFVVAVYVATVVLKGYFVKGVGFLIVTVIYSLIFAHPDVEFKIGDLTSVIYLCLFVFICDNLKPNDYRKAISYYAEGFAISTVIGLFAEKIPAIDNLIKKNVVIVDGKVVDQSRFESILGDPNCFTAINCIVISLILFTNKKIKPRQVLLIIFLVVVGFFTFSKSYILTLAVIVVVYVLKSGRHLIRNILILAMASAVFLVVENIINLDVFNLLISRFSGVESADDLTTGRADLWKQYVDYIFSDIKVFLFGDGFNSQSIYKASHNTYIEMLFRYGFFGCLVWGLAIATGTASVRKNKVSSTRSTIVPLLVFLAVYMFLSAFNFGYVGINLALIIFAMNMPIEEEENAEAQYNSADLQRGEISKQVY